LGYWVIGLFELLGYYFSMEEKSYWLGFSMFLGIGPKRFNLLLEYFGSAKDAWHAPLNELKASGIGNKVSEDFVLFNKNFSIEGYEQLLHAKGVTYVTVLEESYPQRLAGITNPPFVLYVKGNLELLYSPSEKQSDELRSPSTSSGLNGSRLTSFARTITPMIAIVGTRKITNYGKQVTELFTQDLVNAGCIIVSGLALGVDAVAHKATLDAGGKTIAVLGCGVDCCYPSTNSHLYNEIIEQGGAIVSEYGLGVPPNQGSFPSRNRIIAGLSEGVLVTEGAVDSGSLITANDAFKNNRPVFAVPGPITSTLSKGPYELIQKGGRLVVSAKDVLDELGFNNRSTRLRKATSRRRGDTQEEQLIIDLLEEQELSFDEIVKKTKIPSAHIGGILSLMEMKGVVRSEGGLFGLA
jgi:DNA processing protein